VCKLHTQPRLTGSFCLPGSFTFHCSDGFSNPRASMALSCFSPSSSPSPRLVCSTTVSTGGSVGRGPQEEPHRIIPWSVPRTIRPLFKFIVRMGKSSWHSGDNALTTDSPTEPGNVPSNRPDNTFLFFFILGWYLEQAILVAGRQK
jgi:hypothetical protein